MRVSVKDFQIIKSASLEFLPGLTVLQGESNNGKSALFRAIKSCIYNEPGTSNVRVGCKNYLVGIEHNNHKVILQKGENSLYIIDGQQFNKIGKTQVEEVANALGIKTLNINDTTEKINFWDQMEKPFLLDRNSSDLFKFIVDSGEDDNLNNTLRSMVSDKNKLNTEKNLKEGSIATLKQQIDNMENTLAGFSEKIQLCENIISFGPNVSHLVNIANTTTNITNNTKERETITNTIRELKETVQSMESELNTLSYKMSVKAQLEEIISKYNETQNKLNKINDELNNKVDLKTGIWDLTRNIDKYRRLGFILEDVAELNNIIENTKVTKVECRINQADINKLQALHDVIHRISYLQTTLDELGLSCTELYKQYEQFLSEYKNIKICPYCGNKLQQGKEVHTDE